ncbi:MAG TPA: lipocalin-like domain-containing protein [Candidatus Polarisedimenticolaceae bacterium]|nr:lipocalin-like domain-containing protein [Candidatus Polarisedimenticolaceae bacterium]
MRTSEVALCLLLSAAGLVAPAGQAGRAEWTVARPDYVWSFPRDHWRHPGYRLEWWYFTGHLTTEEVPQREFGYQFTLFRIGLGPTPPALDSSWSASELLMGHAAITDKHEKRHVFSEVLYRASGLLAGFNDHPQAEIAWSRAPVGTDGRWRLGWNGEAFDFQMSDTGRGIAFELTTRPLKPLVFQGPNGFSRKSLAAGAASQYYSMTRLETRGTLSFDGKRYDVHGSSWMDQEFSTSHLAEQQVGWDWFSLQLDDGRELMLYVMRRADGTIDHGRGTLVTVGGSPIWLEPSRWDLATTADWTSRESGARYPAGWTIELPEFDIAVDVRPDVADQENVGRLAGGLYYWEGVVTVRDRDGARVGRGYVELTGYGDGNRPPV